METTQRTSPRMDALDRERFQQMIESDLFRAMWARIAAEMRRQQELCEKSESEVEIRRAQGAVKFGRMVLGLPEMLLDEMRTVKRYENFHPNPPKTSNIQM